MVVVNKNRLDEVLVVTEEVIEKVNVLVNKIKPLQDTLNKELAGTNYYARTLKVSNGKYINYGDCIASECDEIRNSTPWKHWKFSNDLNKDNLIIEITDIFHFAPSVELVIDSSIPYEGGMAVLDINRILNSIGDLRSGIDYILDNQDIEMELNDLINYINHTISVNAASHAVLFSKLKYSNELTINELDSLKTSNMEIMLLSLYIYQFVFNSTIDASIDVIYNTYLIKNIVNRFRNNNGYNTGEYKKVWFNDKEDNEIAMDLMSARPNYTADELYKALDDIYIHVG